MAKIRLEEALQALVGDLNAGLDRVPQAMAAAVLDGEEGPDLWVVVDADVVTAHLLVIPLLGSLLTKHPEALGDFLVFPSEGRPLEAILPSEAQVVFRRDRAA